MNEVFEGILAAVALAIGILFGHAGLWSLVASIISGIVTMFFLIVVFAVAVPIARSNFLSGWPRRIAKTILTLQTLVLSWLIAALVAALIYQDEWGFSIFWLVPIPFLLSLFLFVRWIRRLGRNKSTEQMHAETTSKTAPSAASEASDA